MFYLWVAFFLLWLCFMVYWLFFLPVRMNIYFYLFIAFSYSRTLLKPINNWLTHPFRDASAFLMIRDDAK